MNLFIPRISFIHHLGISVMSSPALWAELANFATTNRFAGRFFPPA